MITALRQFWDNYKHEVTHALIRKLEWKLHVLKIKHHNNYPCCDQHKL